MIDAIIFDFGDVLVNLNRKGCEEAFGALGLDRMPDDLERLNHQMEIGAIDETEFLTGIQKHLPERNISEIREAWNMIIGDFPQHRLEFLKTLKKRYKLFLLTNTDRIHIKHFRDKNEKGFADDFFATFAKVYYSFEIGRRKPDPESYLTILREQDLMPGRTLFVDDREDNCEAASALGMHVWHLQPGAEDVCELFTKKFDGYL